ncbi:uncharacterized protein PAC_18118 [Phialocephala subalpina]|uniref:Uncharacterized protein n=1 Tax=Phialocephala subalpina TaxID=576137 RepID=A0A1L7XT78_9HELO|nr:uncharacterized protein PAC_18118 [Phialocephala subalpina]
MDLKWVLLFLFCFASAVHSQSDLSCAVSSISFLADSADGVKLTCLAQTAPAVGCTLANITCQCASKTLPQLSAACMLANCTMAETLALSKVSAQSCQLPFENRTDLLIDVFITILTATGFVVLVRVVSKALDKKLALEDYIIVFALSMSFCSNSMVIAFAHDGFGKHVYSLQNGDLFQALKHFYIAENIYVVVLGLTKISILAFYLRIFQHQEWFRIGVHTLICITILSTAIISILTIFQCHPVTYFWDKDIKDGACLNQNALAYANSGMSIAQDIMIIVLPIPVVVKLNMDIRRKVGVAFMFAVGGFGCIVSIVRLQSLLVFGNSIDPTWDYVSVTIWTALELSAAMICSSMPALRSLMHQMVPKFKFSLLSSRSSASDPSWRTARVWSVHVPTPEGDDLVKLVKIESGVLDIRWPKDEEWGEERIKDVDDRLPTGSKDPKHQSKNAIGS